MTQVIGIHRLPVILPYITGSHEERRTSDFKVESHLAAIKEARIPRSRILFKLRDYVGNDHRRTWVRIAPLLFLFPASDKR